MKKYLFLIFTAFIGLSIISCSDDNGGGTNSPEDKFDPDKNYFPVNAENWWEFEEYGFDKEGEVIDSTKAEGKIIVAADEEKDGKTATVLQSNYDDSGIESYSKYYNKDANGNIWIHSDFVTAVLKNLANGETFELPFEINVPWLKLFDFDKDAWDVYSETVSNLPVTETIIIESGTITLTGKQGESKSIVVNGLKTTAHEFILHFDFTGTIKGFTTEINLQFNMRHWLGGDAGILITSYDNALFDLGSGDPLIFKGAETRVTKYYNAEFVSK
jgi:hypothetical protein